MKVRIKNNRLSLETKVNNLSTCKESDLVEIAAKYQIGDKRLEKRINRKGEEEQTWVPKTRKMLEDDVRRHLTITLDIPKELWDEDMAAMFDDSEVLLEKDIRREMDVKTEAGILIVLRPYEDTKDIRKQMSMMADLTEAQWSYFQEVYCKTIRVETDKDGRKIGEKRSHVRRLEKVEDVPENDEEAKQLEEKTDGKKDK